MPIVKLKIRCRTGELPTVATFCRNSLVRDITDFHDYIPDFDAGYISVLNTKIGLVDGIVNPKKLTGELKLITERIVKNEFALQELMSRLEGYVKRADGLTIGVKDFGIKEVREKYGNDDQEGLDAAIAYLLGNITDNFLALKVKGYTTVQQTALETVKQNIRDDNAAQNLKEEAISELVVSNYVLFNDLWNILIDIDDAGKRVYKTLNPVKVIDYNMSERIRRIRQEQKKSEAVGKVSGNNAPVNKAKVVMKPAVGGRTRSTLTKADGSYEIKSLAAGDYIVTVSAAGFAPKVITVTIVTGEKTVADVSLN